MNFSWSVGVTTCPRNNGGYLDQCLESIHAAGWPDIQVHNDPDHKLGPWGNLQVAIRAAAANDPDAAMFVQDDTLVSAHLREHLEAVLPDQPWWPTCGVFSLYVNEATAKCMKQGFHVIDMQRFAGRHGGGACAFIMPRDALQLMVKDFPWPGAWHLAEIWLQSWAGQPSIKKPWIDHIPSFARHVGKVSALKKIPNESTERPEPAWSEWRHEGTWIEDCLDYFPKIVHDAKMTVAKPVSTTLF